MEALEFAPTRFFPDLGKAVYKVHADLGGHFIASFVMPKKNGIEVLEEIKRKNV